MSDIEIDTTAAFDAGDKDEDELLNKIETETDSLRVDPDIIKLGSLLSSKFNIDSVDGSNWMFTAMYSPPEAISTGGAASIGSGDLSLSVINPDANGGYIVVTPEALTGNFSVQVDLTCLAVFETNTAAYLKLTKNINNSDDIVQIGRANSTGLERIRTIARWNGVPVTSVNVNSSATTPQLRITREGTSVKTYYNIGAGWILTDTSVNADIDDLFVILRVSGRTTETVEVDFHNYLVNSGSFTNNTYRTEGTWTSINYDPADLTRLAKQFMKVTDADANNTVTLKIIDTAGTKLEQTLNSDGTYQFKYSDFGRITTQWHFEVDFGGDGDNSPAVEFLNADYGRSNAIFI